MPGASTIVFTDGAAKGNPGPGGWGAIIVTPDERVAELGGGAPHTTNNRMELSGAIAALQHVAGRSEPVAIYTDSTYLIQGITQWIWGWRKRGWKTAEGADVLNRELWEELSALAAARNGSNARLEWHWVRGHVGTPGNERADEISVTFALRQRIDLYSGPLSGYPLAIFPLPGETTLPKRSPSSGASAKTKAGAYSYVSVVGGIPMRHPTWADCERRVKGQPGARFKKAASAADEAAILSGWGIDPSRIAP
jgi:ribonuclease HI